MKGFNLEVGELVKVSKGLFNNYPLYTGVISISRILNYHSNIWFINHKVVSTRSKHKLSRLIY